MTTITTNSHVTVKSDANESALRILNNAVVGKSLSYDAPFYCEEGKDPCDGLSIRLADDPEEEDDTEIQILPILTAEGKPVLSIYCHPCGKPDSLANETSSPADTVSHPTALERREMYKVQKKEKHEHKLTDYTLATREHIAQMTEDQLAEFGHDPFSGPEQMTAALDTIDALAVYNEPAAWSSYSAFMDSNLSGMWFEFHDETQQ